MLWKRTCLLLLHPLAFVPSFHFHASFPPYFPSIFISLEWGIVGHSFETWSLAPQFPIPYPLVLHIIPPFRYPQPSHPFTIFSSSNHSIQIISIIKSFIFSSICIYLDQISSLPFNTLSSREHLSSCSLAFPFHSNSIHPLSYHILSKFFYLSHDTELQPIKLSLSNSDCKQTYTNSQ